MRLTQLMVLYQVYLQDFDEMSCCCRPGEARKAARREVGPAGQEEEEEGGIVDAGLRPAYSG